MKKLILLTAALSLSACCHGHGKLGDFCGRQGDLPCEAGLTCAEYGGKNHPTACVALVVDPNKPAAPQGETFGESRPETTPAPTPVDPLNSVMDRIKAESNPAPTPAEHPEEDPGH